MIPIGDARECPSRQSTPRGGWKHRESPWREHASFVDRHWRLAAADRIPATLHVTTLGVCESRFNYSGSTWVRFENHVGQAGVQGEFGRTNSSPLLQNKPIFKVSERREMAALILASFRKTHLAGSRCSSGHGTGLAQHVRHCGPDRRSPPAYTLGQAARRFNLQNEPNFYSDPLSGRRRLAHPVPNTPTLVCRLLKSERDILSTAAPDIAKDSPSQTSS